MNSLDLFIKKIIILFEKYADLILGMITVIVSVIMFIVAGTFKISGQSVSVLDSAQFLPKLIFALLCIIGLFITIENILKHKKRMIKVDEAKDYTASILAFKRSIITLLSIFVLIFLMTKLGFILSAILYLIFSMLFMSEKAGWKKKTYVIVSIIFSIACYYFFAKYVYVNLPLGILEGVL